MTQKTAIWIRIGLILVALLLASGCATVHPTDAAGSGTYSYVSGWLSWTYPAAMQTTWSATLQALQTLSLRIETKTLDGLGGHIKALRADQTKVTVQLRPINARTTRVSVHVGTFGDREGSEEIHKAIRAALNL